MRKVSWVLFVLATFFLPLSFAQDNEAQPLKADQIKQLVSDMSAACVKEKDGSTCITYMGTDGVVKRLTHIDSKVRKGAWHVSDDDRLCILWEGKKKALCFAVSALPNNTYQLHKKGKLKSTIIALMPGDKIGDFTTH